MGGTGDVSPAGLGGVVGGVRVAGRTVDVIFFFFIAT